MLKNAFKFKKEHVHQWTRIGPVELINFNRIYPWHFEKYCALFICSDKKCDTKEFRNVQDLIGFKTGYAMTELVYRARHGHLWGESIQFVSSVNKNATPTYLGNNRVGYNGY